METAFTETADRSLSIQSTPFRSRRKAQHTHITYTDRENFATAQSSVHVINDVQITPATSSTQPVEWNNSAISAGSDSCIRNLASIFDNLAAENIVEESDLSNPTPVAVGNSSLNTRCNTRLRKAIHVLVDSNNGCFAADEKMNRIQEFSCGTLTFECRHCSALLIRKEHNSGKYNKYCYGGKVVHPRSSCYPAEMRKLLTQQGKRERVFREIIRLYNNALAFASFSHGLIEAPGRGMQTYNIHGQTYHRISSIHPSKSSPSFAQLYILDSSIANEQRTAFAVRRLTQETNRRQKINAEIMNILDQIIRSLNPYVQAYQMMKEVEENEKQAALEENRPIREVTMWIGDTNKHHPRRYNAPTCNEIAVVFTGRDGEPPTSRQVAVHSRDGVLRYMHYNNPT